MTKSDKSNLPRLSLEPLSEAEQAKATLSFSFSKKEAGNILQMLKPAYDKYDIEFVGQPQLKAALGLWFTKTAQGTQTTAKAIIMQAFGSVSNLKKIVAAWDEDYRSYVEYMARNVYITVAGYKARQAAYLKDTRHPCRLPLSSTYDDYESGSSSWRSKPSYYKLPDKLLPYLRDAFDMVCHNVDTFGELPAGEANLEIMACEKTICSHIEGLHRHLAMYEVDLSASKVKVGDVKPIENLMEFPSPWASFSKNFRYYVARNFVEWWKGARMSAKKDYPSVTVSYAKGLRRSLTPPYSSTYQLFCNAVPYFTKYYANVFDSYQIANLLQALVGTLAKTERDNGKAMKWMSASDVVNMAVNSCSERDWTGCRIEDLEHYYVYNDLSGEQLTHANAVREIGEGQMFAYLASLASAGLVDVAFEKLDNSCYAQFFRCIRYVRLTPLGQYAMSVSSKYVCDTAPSESDELAYPIVLQPDRLLLKALTEEAAAFVKANIGEKISSRLFVVTEESMRRKVNDLSQLNVKVNHLKKLSGDKELPPVWQELVDRIKGCLNSIKRDNEAYLVYDVDLGDKYVSDVLSTDPEVGKLIRRVEGGSFIVKRSDIYALQGILANRGIKIDAPSSYYYY